MDSDIVAALKTLRLQIQWFKRKERIEGPRLMDFLKIARWGAGP